jgi:cytochrome c-type biogenesis protein CcmH
MYLGIVVAAAVLLVAFAGGRVAAADRGTIEREAREIEALIVAPCCFHQQVSVHQSALAAELKGDIRNRLAAGQTREQILAAYVDRWGTRVLAQPPRQGFSWTLYLAPPIAFALTAAAVFAIVWRFARRTAPDEPSPAPPSVLPAAFGYDERIDDELADLT